MRRQGTITGTANGEIPVEIAEIAVPKAPRIQHENITNCQWAFVRWRDDIKIATRPSRPNKVADIINTSLQRTDFELAEHFGKRQSGMHPVRNSGKNIRGNGANMP